ncbi:hypothetical protein OC845_006731, partial [Tilletia horrida]
TLDVLRAPSHPRHRLSSPTPAILRRRRGRQRHTRTLHRRPRARHWHTRSLHYHHLQKIQELH